MTAGKPDFTKPMKIGPLQWGFDYSYVLLGGHQAPPYCSSRTTASRATAPRSRSWRPGRSTAASSPSTGRACRTGTAARSARRWSRRRSRSSTPDKDKPFYIHLSTDGAHGPYTPPDDILGTPVKGVSKMTPKTDMVHEVDVVVGKIVEALEKRGLLENTLIVVTSDNGGIPADRETFGHDAVGGLRGSKSYIWEGGHRVPFVAMWKGRVPAGAVRNQVIGTHDIVPTFVELAGGKFAADQMLDSVSLAPVLLGKRGDDQPVRQTLLIQSSPGPRRVHRGHRQAGAVHGREAEGRRPEADARGTPSRPRTRRATRSPRRARSPAATAWPTPCAKARGSSSSTSSTTSPSRSTTSPTTWPSRRTSSATKRRRTRIARMDKLYRDIRSSKRSTPVGQP